MDYYTPKHFKVHEFVTPAVYKKLGENSLLVIDYRMLKTADAIREFFKAPVTINTWGYGGDRKFSGFRDSTCGIGAKFSQHRFGRALDMLIDDIPASVARQVIINNPGRFPYITVMEDDVSWLHVDCRCTVNKEIVLFKP